MRADGSTDETCSKTGHTIEKGDQQQSTFAKMYTFQPRGLLLILHQFNN